MSDQPILDAFGQHRAERQERIERRIESSPFSSSPAAHALIRDREIAES